MLRIPSKMLAIKNGVPKKSNCIWDNISSKWIVCKAPKCKRRLNRQGDKYQHVFYHEKLPMWDSMSTNYPSRSIHSKELGANSSFFVAGCLLAAAASLVWIISTFLQTILLSRNGILLPKLFWPTVRKNCFLNEKNFWNSRLKADNL